MSPSQLGFHFGFIAVGYMVGNFVSGRYAGRVGINRMMLAGGIVATAGILLAMAFFLAGVVDAARLLRLDPLRRARQRPAAAERQCRDRLGAAAPRRLRLGSRRRADDRRRRLAVGRGRPVLGPDTGAWPLLAIMLASSALGVVSTLDVMRLAGRHDL